MSSAELLRYAIVEVACKDYEWAIRYLNRMDHKGLTLTKTQKDQIAKARNYKESCERFFTGEWYTALSEIDGKMLMDALRQRAVTEQYTISRHKL